MTHEGRRIEIAGTVQGVGFRPWVYRLAREEGIAGRVSNGAQGVTIEAFGGGEALDSFLSRLQASPPPAARIRNLYWHAIPSEPARGFEIVASRDEGGRRVSIPPDLATCDECLAEVFDPSDRRYRYPFTNCTNCGPRFTIARGIPYDRPDHDDGVLSDVRRLPAGVRLAARPAFSRAAECVPEVRAAADRGLADGRKLAGEDPLALAARALAEGLIVAVKGIGGFHLACDATLSAAVARLRARKRREEKPFAVMVPDAAAAGRLAVLGERDRSLLCSIERPIVLVPRRPGAAVAPEVAPGNPMLGLLLAYSPLHHLLLADTGRPLVMTSGNLSDEPIICDNAEALERLGAVADLFLLHDRDIASRSDDSVARIVADRPVVFRRSRGYVPRGIPVRRPFDRPVLACGGHLKNTFCIGLGDMVYPGPHIGDLEGLDAVRAFEEAVERAERFLGVSPEIVAHDLHPLYASTAYALSRPEPLRIAVQHHHAHVVSAMAEHGLEGPVLGVAYDGTGYGPDGASWGGEILLATEERFDRLATLRPIRLPGADRAIREVWRIAVALLEDAFEGDPPLEAFALFSRIPPSRLRLVRQMAARGIQSPPAHGLGRYFDALGSLFLNRPTSRYEGQVALEWNLAADPGERAFYPFELVPGEGDLHVIDLRPLVRAAAADHIAGAPPSRISARFHNTLVRATGAAVREAAETAGLLPVVLTGGCFQNARLAEGLLRELSPTFRVHLHGEVPPGDGGLAIGQAVVAAAVARSRKGGL